MGYDISRFKDGIDEELLCSICGDVLQNPVQAPSCEHVFCGACISTWLAGNRTCPIDRLPLTISVLQQLPRIIRNLLSKQPIACANKQHGCMVVVRLELIDTHQTSCEFDPNKPIECSSGCGLMIPQCQNEKHNCVKSLRDVVRRQDIKIERSKNLLTELKSQLEEVHRQIGGVKDFILYKPACIIPPPIYDDFETREELMRWSSNLNIAIVERWGGVISTPDIVLQLLIKRALIACNCPTRLVTTLMDNCHERNWPFGLNSLETRQANRDRFILYRAKKIPGKQAVVIMSCDNLDIEDDIIMEPGIVMIFANGIE